VIQEEYKERVASESANSADAVPHQANFCKKKLPRTEFESDSKDEDTTKSSKETYNSSDTYPDTTDTEEESELEGEKLFDIQEQSIPHASIEVGRMAEDPSDMLNNISLPIEVGRNAADASPESLNGPTLAQRRQKLKDLRAATKIRLDNYVHKVIGNIQAGRKPVTASTQSISTQGLSQARQTLQDLRTDIKVKLDNYVRRETGNLQSLHLSGTESMEPPPKTQGQVQASGYKTLEQPKASNLTPATRPRRSRQRTKCMYIPAHFVFDRGKKVYQFMNQLKKMKPMR
jgi:hypothetical protein